MGEKDAGQTRSEAADVAVRCLFMAVGVSLVGAGIALAKYSQTGTTPISVPAAIVADAAARDGNAKLTLGTCVFVLNMLFLAGQVALLRRDFAPMQLLQIPAQLVMSWSCDRWMLLWQHIPLANYAVQLDCLASSIMLLGLGICLEVKANVIMIPGDAFVRVAAHVLGRPFPRCKVVFDTSLMALGVVMSFVLLDGLFDVREGTIISATLTGRAVQLCNRLLAPLDNVLPPGASVIPPVVPGA